MDHDAGTCPLSRQEIVDAYFIEHRTKILDIAAFLDRLDRASVGAEDDFRLRAFRKALAVLTRDGSRMLDVQMIFSDPRTELLDALDQKSADGAPKEA